MRNLVAAGALAGGIAACALAPGGDLLALVTGAGRLLTLTPELDVVAEVDLLQHAAAVQPAAPTKVAADAMEAAATAAEADELGAVCISWRGDGRFFATISGPVGGRLVRLWEADGCLLHSSAGGLHGAPVAWQPSGALIVGGAASGAALFFERNGLQRGPPLDLRVPAGAAIADLQWSCDSELLGAVLRGPTYNCVQARTSPEFARTNRIWHRSNYHWYLKAEWRAAPGDGLHVRWDAERPLRLMLWTEGGALRRIDLAWSSAAAGCASGTAAVVDGADVLVTPLARAIVPPPMALARTRFRAPVRCLDLVVTAGGGLERLAAALVDGSLAVTDVLVDEAQEAEDEEREVGTTSLATVGALHLPDAAADKAGEVVHLAWLSSQVLLVATVFTEDSGGTAAWRLLLIEVAQYGGGCWSGTLVAQASLDAPVVRMAQVWDSAGCTTGALVELHGGALVRVPAAAKAGLPLLDASPAVLAALPCTCLQLSAVELVATDGGVVAVGLSESGRLYAGQVLVAEHCTSFVLHRGDSAAVTVADHSSAKETAAIAAATLPPAWSIVYLVDERLHVVDLESVLSSRAPGAGTEAEVQGRGERGQAQQRPAQPVWEKGARLVAAARSVGCAAASTFGCAPVVLQTQRGSLETVFPRSLVLRGVAAVLRADDIGLALAAARRHRLDLNVLVDGLGWRRFVERGAVHLVQQANLAHVTELVCALRRDNVVTAGGIYEGLLPPQHGDNNDDDDAPPPEGKVTAVCSAIRRALEVEAPAGQAREACILTTLAKSDPPELEAALHRIRRLRDEELLSSAAAMRSSDGDAAHCLPAPTSEDVAGRAASGTVAPLMVDERATICTKMSAEAALRHLMWLADGDRVFDAALGMYDCGLAAMVASLSQKDPAEILPLLRELQSMPMPLMRATIDRRLGRIESALRNLAQAGSNHLETCLQLLRDHPLLFPAAIAIFAASSGGTEQAGGSSDAMSRQRVLQEWGQHLQEAEQFREAAGAFVAAGLPDRALAACRAGGLWRGAMLLASRLKMPPAELRELHNVLLKELLHMGKHEEAARMAMEYCEDKVGTIGLLVQVHHWEEAARIAYVHGLDEVVDGMIRDNAVERAHDLCRSCVEGVEKVGRYIVQFQALRQRRRLLAEKLVEVQGSRGGDDGMAEDSASESGSSVSNLSLYTHGSRATAATSETGSAASSRRANRKQAKLAARGLNRIRAGSPQEEQALVEHLVGLAPSAALKEEVAQLLDLLILLQHADLARKLQTSLHKLLTSHLAAVASVEADLAADMTAPLAAGGRGRDVVGSAVVDKRNWLTPPSRAADLRWAQAILEPVPGEAGPGNVKQGKVAWT
eukprot:SM000287S10614  [mRNA]  locus=s287:107124:112629:+ [translate_table: standard]